MSVFQWPTKIEHSRSTRTCWASVCSQINPSTKSNAGWNLGIAGADTRIVLFRFGEKLQPGGQLNVTLWADDVEATAQELKAKGVEFVMDPKRMPYGTTSIFKDIDGNCLVLSSR